jgi:hypothetical protein
MNQEPASGGRARLGPKLEGQGNQNERSLK